MKKIVTQPYFYYMRGLWGYWLLTVVLAICFGTLSHYTEGTESKLYWVVSGVTVIFAVSRLDDIFCMYKKSAAMREEDDDESQ